MTYTPMRCTPVRCTLMRYTPMVFINRKLGLRLESGRILWKDELVFCLPEKKMKDLAESKKMCESLSSLFQKRILRIEAARTAIPCCRIRGLTTAHTFLPSSTIDVETYLACLKTIRPFEIVRYCSCLSNIATPRPSETLPSDRSGTMNIGDCLAKLSLAERRRVAWWKVL